MNYCAASTVVSLHLLEDSNSLVVIVAQDLGDAEGKPEGDFDVGSQQCLGSGDGID
jgi:hypothetical protein